MNLAFRSKLLVASLAVAAAGFAASLTPSIGQEAKTQKKATGRLPAYYADIVTPEQKEKIYAIQAKHEEKIDAAKAAVAALTKAQDAEIESVLTPDQKVKLKKAQDDAAAAKKKKADEKKAADKAADTKTKTETKTTPKSK